MWVYTETKPPSPVPRQMSDDTGVLEGAPSVDNGWTQTMSEQQILDWDTLGSGCQGGLPSQAKDWERGVTVCLEDSCPHLNANVLSGGTTMFPRIGEPTTKELTSLAPPFSHQQSRSTQCDLVDVPGPHLYQLMWTSKGEFDESGPTARLRPDAPGHRGHRIFLLSGSVVPAHGKFAQDLLLQVQAGPRMKMNRW